MLPERLAVCRLPADSETPPWLTGSVRSVTWTADETSIVVAESAVPSAVESVGGWRSLKVAGPLDLSLTGVLSSIAQPLAEAGVSIYAVSTFDTDYVLVAERDLGTALGVLESAGHKVAMS